MLWFYSTSVWTVWIMTLKPFFKKQNATQTPVKSPHTPHTHTHSENAQQAWGGGPLLPSRDQQTAVNPLLKILANPLGLLRIASGHCVCHKSGITHWKAHPQGAPTPDPLSRHVWGAKAPVAVQLSSTVRFAELHQVPPKGSKVAGSEVFKFRCFKEAKKDKSFKSKQPLNWGVMSEIAASVDWRPLTWIRCNVLLNLHLHQKEARLHLQSELSRPRWLILGTMPGSRYASWRKLCILHIKWTLHHGAPQQP